MHDRIEIHQTPEGWTWTFYSQSGAKMALSAKPYSTRSAAVLAVTTVRAQIGKAKAFSTSAESFEKQSTGETILEAQLMSDAPAPK